MHKPLLLTVALLAATTYPVVSSAQSWTPPIGIPAPPFGITQQAGSATHYVDNTKACSDSGNGTLASPRCTIPATSLPTVSEGS